MLVLAVIPTFNHDNGTSDRLGYVSCEGAIREVSTVRLGSNFTGSEEHNLQPISLDAADLIQGSGSSTGEPGPFQ